MTNIGTENVISVPIIFLKLTKKGGIVMTVMRSLRRGVAHRRMQIAGFVGVNDHKHGKSFFSLNWRDYLVRTKQK